LSSLFPRSLRQTRSLRPALELPPFPVCLRGSAPIFFEQGFLSLDRTVEDGASSQPHYKNFPYYLHPLAEYIWSLRNNPTFSVRRTRAGAKRFVISSLRTAMKYAFLPDQHVPWTQANTRPGGKYDISFVGKRSAPRLCTRASAEVLQANKTRVFPLPPPFPCVTLAFSPSHATAWRFIC